MSITPLIFQQDFPEFSNSGAYPSQTIAFYLQTATLLQNPLIWPQAPGPGNYASGTFTFNGQPANGDTITLNGTVVTFVSTTPVTYQIAIGPTLADTLSNAVTFLQMNISSDVNIGQFTYILNNSNSAIYAIATNTGLPGNLLTIAASSVNIAVSGPTLTGGAQGRSLFDIGVELYTAHYLVLERQAQKSADRNAPPGVTRGMITSEAVGGASVAYNPGTMNPNDSHWVQTQYGLRYIQLVRQVGAMPIQVGIGIPPPGVGYGCGYLNGPGWYGPPVDGNTGGGFI